jgi:bacterial/archaeal transporter family protein
MAWVLLSLFSALILGFYDLAKKHAVADNAVLPVLFFSNLVSALVWLGLMGAGPLLPDALRVAPLTPLGHLQLGAKAALVGTSWIFAYFALKHLPVSLAGPIRATGPMWTLGGAVLLFAERPSGLQWIGIAVTLLGFFSLSLAGRREGIRFHRDRWVGFLLVGTLLGACSGLYDKFLLGSGRFSAATVQAWFSIYLVLFFAPLAYGWKRQWWPRGRFRWRWSIPAIGLLLLVADFAYFRALSDPEALVSVVSSLRRGAVLVTFAGGILLLGERHGRAKLPGTLAVLAGIVTLVLG